MPIPDKDAARRIVESVKWTEGTRRQQNPRGRRRRIVDGTEVEMVQATAPIPAATVTAAGVTTPGTGSVYLLDRQAATLVRSATQETLENYSKNILAPDATPTDAESLPALREHGTLVYREGTGEKGDPGPSGLSGNGRLFEFIEALDAPATTAMVKLLNLDLSDVTSQIVVNEVVADETARLALASGTGAGEIDEDEICEQTNGSDPSTYWQMDNSGDPSLPGSWTNVPSDTHAIVIDNVSTIEAWPEYTSALGATETTTGSLELGFIGSGPIFDANYMDNGFPAIIPDEVQGFCEIIVVKLKQTVGVGDAAEINAELVQMYGGNGTDRPPVQHTWGSSPAQYGVKVTDPLGLAVGAKTDEDWLAVRSFATPPTDEPYGYQLVQPSKDLTLIKGTATASYPDTTPLYLSNVMSMAGTVPALSPGPTPPANRVQVAVTSPLKIGNGDTVYAMYDRSIGGEEWQNWRATVGFDVRQQLRGLPDYTSDAVTNQEIRNVAGVIGWKSATIVQRFRLTADFTLANTTVAAELINDDGTVPGTPTAITITDTNEEFFGYGPYTDPDDTAQPGFRGVVVRYLDPAEKWYIAEIEKVFPAILVELNTNIQAGTGPHESYFRKGFGGDYRNPKQSAAGVINVYNTEHFADNASDGQLWYCVYDSVAAKYEMLHGLSAGERRYGMVTGEIPAAAYNGGALTVTPGDSTTAVVTVLRWNTAGDGLEEDTSFGSALFGRNVTSTSRAVGSVAQPVVMAGTIQFLDSILWFVIEPFDLYSLFGNTFGSAPSSDDPDLKIPYKSGGSREYQVDSEDCSA